MPHTKPSQSLTATLLRLGALLCLGALSLPSHAANPASAIECNQALAAHDYDTPRWYYHDQDQLIARLQLPPKGELHIEARRDHSGPVGERHKRVTLAKYALDAIEQSDAAATTVMLDIAITLPEAYRTRLSYHYFATPENACEPGQLVSQTGLIRAPMHANDALRAVHHSQPIGAH